MQQVAIFSHFEAETPQEDYERHGVARGCVSYPVVITDESSASSYGQLVVVLPRRRGHLDVDSPDGFLAGEPHGPADMPAGALQVPAGSLAEQLQTFGYEVEDHDAMEEWRHAPGATEPNEDARVIVY